MTYPNPEDTLSVKINKAVTACVNDMLDNPCANLDLVLDAIQSMKTEGEKRNVYAALKFSLEQSVIRGVLAGLKF